MENERIILGSGFLYIIPYTGTIPKDEIIEVDANLLGLIQGGATIEYKPSYYTAKDDKAMVSKTILTEEEVTLKSGVMTWCAETLDKLCDTARTTSTATQKVVKVGGIGNQKGKKYIVHFHHEDPMDGDIRVTIVGNNEAGFSLAFQKDKETIVDAEFKAKPMDGEGTLITYKEDIIKSA